MNTLMEYLYRDASNYKQYGSIVLQGSIALTSIRHLLFDKTYFIPSQVGLPDLHHKFAEQGFEYPTEDDHEWHEIISMRPTSREPTTPLQRNEFLSRLRKSKGEK
ncbi:MAG: hypothetical protein WCW52_03050 [Elusimicrobiales bacterium]|jgi:hypothetical protein